MDRENEGSWLGNLGAILAALGHNALAIEYTEQAMAVTLEVDDRKGESVLLGNLALRYGAIGQIARAIDYCRKAVQISRETQAEEFKAVKLSNLGDAYLCNLAGLTTRCAVLRKRWRSHDASVIALWRQERT